MIKLNYEKNLVVFVKLTQNLVFWFVHLSSFVFVHLSSFAFKNILNIYLGSRFEFIKL